MRFDPADDERANTAIKAGGVFLSTINKCLVQMEQARNTAIAACDASKEMDDYIAAKRRITKPVPKLGPLEQQIQSARAEAESAMIRLALSARSEPRVPPARTASSANER